MSEPLKPCPFCGGEACPDDYVGGYYVYCTKCNVGNEMYSSPERAAAVWNNRPDSPEVAALRARAEKAEAEAAALRARAESAELDRDVKREVTELALEEVRTVERQNAALRAELAELRRATGRDHEALED